VITNRVGLVLSSNAVLTVSGSSPADLAHKANASHSSAQQSISVPHPMIAEAQILPNGAFQFSIAGASAQTLIVQTSTTLLPGSWVNLSTNAVANGQVTFTDGIASHDNARFYRAMSPP
jgi:hypothetical protein